MTDSDKPLLQKIVESVKTTPGLAIATVVAVGVAVGTLLMKNRSEPEQVIPEYSQKMDDVAAQNVLPDDLLIGDVTENHVNNDKNVSSELEGEQEKVAEGLERANDILNEMSDVIAEQHERLMEELDKRGLTFDLELDEENSENLSLDQLWDREIREAQRLLFVDENGYEPEDLVDRWKKLAEEAAVGNAPAFDLSGIRGELEEWLDEHPEFDNDVSERYLAEYTEIAQEFSKATGGDGDIKKEEAFEKIQDTSSLDLMQEMVRNLATVEYIQTRQELEEAAGLEVTPAGDLHMSISRFQESEVQIEYARLENIKAEIERQNPGVKIIDRYKEEETSGNFVERLDNSRSDKRER